jgi:hypothetical protein
MDTISVAISMSFEMGLSNSFRPFLRKYVWIEKAKMPPKHKINENIRPDIECLETKINPYRTKSNSGKWISRNPVIPPGSLNNSHSFQ